MNPCPYSYLNAKMDGLNPFHRPLVMTDLPDDSESTPKPRGLWSVISHSSAPMQSDSEADLPEESDADREQPIETESNETPAPRSLFAVMRLAEPTETVADDQIDATSGQQPLKTSESAEPPDLSDTSVVPTYLPIVQPPNALLKSARKSGTTRIRQGSISFLCGLSSVPLSALSLRPEVWISIPASALGFCAILLGYMALTGGRLRELSSFTKITSQSGMLLGTLGLFLGPLVFAGIGRELRESSGHHLTRKHLAAIGEALDRFHEQHGSFPVGGTSVREASGSFHGQHGWMTFLLPFIGEESLYTQIDQSKPFDAPENRKPMSRDVETYYAAGGDRTKIGQGFAVAHFAGVGGDIEDKSALVHAGIFASDGAVKKADVTDGLANTIIVGELAGNYPPWGDPENWRTIGKGLNKDVNGFGNAAGTGAMFLFGDGSIRMLSNKTNPRLLKQLSSRDGADTAP